MKKAMALAFMLALLLPIAAMAEEPQSTTDDSVRLIRVSPHGDKAIIRGSDGKMRMIKVGDSIGDNGKVTEIAKDKVMIEKNTENGVESVTVQPGSRRERPARRNVGNEDTERRDEGRKKIEK